MTTITDSLQMLYVKPESRHGTLLLAVLLLTLGSASCSSEGPTEPSPPPADQQLSVKKIQGDQQTVMAGQSARNPLIVEVRNEDGQPQSDIRVRFTTTSQVGEVRPGQTRTDQQGRVRANFTATSATGQARVRVDLPTHPETPSTHFQLEVIPEGHVRLEKVGGTQQKGEPGSQLGETFQVQLEGPRQRGGIQLLWTILEGSPGARLLQDTTFTNPRGETENLLELGRETGLHRIQVRAQGPFSSDTIVFEAQSTHRLADNLTLDSIRPQPLQPDQRARLFGANLEEAETITVAGTQASIVEQASQQIQIRVPAFQDRCWPAHQASIRALTPQGPTPSLQAPMNGTGTRVELAPGQVRAFKGSGASQCLHFPAHQDLRDLFYIVQSGATQPRASFGTRLLFRQASEVGETRAAANARAGLQQTLQPGRFGPDRSIHQQLRQQSIQALRWAPRSTELNEPASETHPSEARLKTGTYREGDTLKFIRAFEDRQGPISCADTAGFVEGVVQETRRTVALVRDIEVIEGGTFTDQQWNRLAEELDQTTLPAIREQFGQEQDINNDGRIIVLFTHEVNRLGDPDGQPPGGFFLNLDIFDSGDPEGQGATGEQGEVCPISNEAELVWLPLPDPQGILTEPVDQSQAFRSARSVINHEVQHLINAERRIIEQGGGLADLETTWLNEGLSHMAEEVAGFALTNKQPGQNLALEDFPEGAVAGTPFRAFLLSNFGRARFFLEDPSTTIALAEREPFGVESRKMRGFAWLFVRWLLDQQGGQHQLLREWAVGGRGLYTGIDNLEETTGQRWEEMLGDFALAVAGDDITRHKLSAEHQLTTWDLRTTFQQLQSVPEVSHVFPGQEYPLQIQELGSAGQIFEFEIQSGTSRFFRLFGPRGGEGVSLELMGLAGGTVPLETGVQVIVGRTR